MISFYLELSGDFPFVCSQSAIDLVGLGRFGCAEQHAPHLNTPKHYRRQCHARCDGRETRLRVLSGQVAAMVHVGVTWCTCMPCQTLSWSRLHLLISRALQLRSKPCTSCTQRLHIVSFAAILPTSGIQSLKSTTHTLCLLLRLSRCRAVAYVPFSAQRTHTGGDFWPVH